MATGLTEPPAVGHDAGVGELFRLEVVPEHLPGAVPLGPRLVHLEPPHGGRGPAPAAGAAARALLVIGAVDVVRVPRLARHVHRLLLLLRHLLLPRLFGNLVSSRVRGEGRVKKSRRRRREGGNDVGKLGFSEETDGSGGVGGVTCTCASGM